MNLNCIPLAFTSYKPFLKNKKRSGTSPPAASFSACFLKTNVFIFLFYFYILTGLCLLRYWTIRNFSHTTFFKLRVTSSINIPAESSFSILAASACEIHEPLFLSLLSLIPFQNSECDSLIHIHCHRFVIWKFYFSKY